MRATLEFCALEFCDRRNARHDLLLAARYEGAWCSEKDPSGRWAAGPFVLRYMLLRSRHSLRDKKAVGRSGLTAFVLYSCKLRPTDSVGVTTSTLEIQDQPDSRIPSAQFRYRLSCKVQNP